MKTTPTSYHLLAPESTAASGFHVLRVSSAGASFVHKGAGGRAGLSRRRPAGAGWAAVEHRHARRGPTGLVLALPADGTETWINGGQALPLAVLRDGDEVLFDFLEATLLVARFLSPWRGPAPSTAAGSDCPVCRSPVKTGAMIYRCPCGAVLHTGGDHPGKHAGCIAAVEACPVCQQSILAQPGYAHEPIMP